MRRIFEVLEPSVPNAAAGRNQNAISIDREPAAAQLLAIGCWPLAPPPTRPAEPGPSFRHHDGKTDKQRSGMTTRSFRLLRDHGVIRRLPKSRRYQLTANGRQLVTALLAALSASTQELTRIAA